MENEVRVEEIKKQIKELQAELKELQTPPLVKLVKYTPYDNSLGTIRKPNYSDAWNDLTNLARRIWRGRGKNIPFIRNLSKEQVQLSADFLNEVIPIYNKYWEMARKKNGKG